MTTIDYDPLARQQVIGKPTGLLGRRKLRESLQPVGFGFERVFVDADGVVHPISGALTAGERYWASGGTWLSVDVADHSLTYPFSHRDVDGSASYRIDATVTVRIADSAEAVRRQIRSVRVYVEPALRSVIGDALTGRPDAKEAQGLVKLNSRRAEIEHLLRDRLRPGTSIKIENWLVVRLADLAVVFDSETAAHHDRLVSKARGLELDDAERRQRTAWADYFGPLLGDPLGRAVQLVAADPSKENLARVADVINADERLHRDEVLKIMERLIDNNWVQDAAELKALRVIVDSLILPGTVPNADRAARELPSAQADPGGPAGSVWRQDQCG